MCPPGYHHNGIMAARELGQTKYIYIYIDIYIYIYINGRQVVVPDKNSAQCLKAEPYINKSGVKDDTWIFL